jgi:hypothetical protein
MKIVLDMVVNHAGYGADERFDPTWFNVEGSGDIKGELAGRSSALPAERSASSWTAVDDRAPWLSFLPPAGTRGQRGLALQLEHLLLEM